MKEIISLIYVFVCQKCGHCWLPRSRDYNDLPQHCPKCHDNYWFISHKKLKEIKKENAVNILKTNEVVLEEERKKRIITKKQKYKW